MSKTTAGQFALCPTCAVAVSNGDDSAMRADHVARLEAMLAEAGAPLAHAGTYEDGGYWNCDGCWETEIGDGELYVTV